MYPVSEGYLAVEEGEIGSVHTFHWNGWSFTGTVLRTVCLLFFKKSVSVRGGKNVPERVGFYRCCKAPFHSHLPEIPS